MRTLQEIATDEETMSSIMQLTGAFEGIASMHIARIKDKVQKSEAFFADLWPIYQRLQAGNEFRSGRARKRGQKLNNKELHIIITSEGSLSGDIDHRVVRELVNTYDPDEHDILVLGHHGASELNQRKIKYLASYKIPGEDEPINFDPVVNRIRGYKKSTIYYPSYVSLMVQDVKKIELGDAVAELGEQVANNKGAINASDYIFEPSVEAVIDYMERSMLYVVLSQVILFSRLAQHASRFRAMTAARSMAEESRDDFRLELNRTKRSIKDQRTREIINGMRRSTS